MIVSSDYGAYELCDETLEVIEQRLRTNMFISGSQLYFMQGNTIMQTMYTLWLMDEY